MPIGVVGLLCRRHRMDVAGRIHEHRDQTDTDEYRRCCLAWALAITPSEMNTVAA
jgi:hypothetical protein